MNNIAELHDGPEYRALATKLFIGQLRYTDVTVRIVSIAENAAIVRDSSGKLRVVKFKDCSFASEHIARQNEGCTMMLKIRAWS